MSLACSFLGSRLGLQLSSFGLQLARVAFSLKGVRAAVVCIRASSALFSIILCLLILCSSQVKYMRLLGLIVSGL
ncbi:hypothetical protein HanXRQr2_Chr10g0428531 [Helianthus annuus]|uniref:Uncharacterized protein n=1 Tax=Helianthus annuus TaxID=4232 RepID=A0A251THE9_HELAN|nr:hypothetical protein HanXRQr2_Chr10g0428531 [Helianthus annuus]